MDREQLNTELTSFRLACIEKNVISNNDFFEFEEVYKGIFIVDVFAKQEWLNEQHNVSALNTLIELLYKTTEPKTRESILTLRIGITANLSCPIKLGEVTASGIVG